MTKLMRCMSRSLENPITVPNAVPVSLDTSIAGNELASEIDKGLARWQLNHGVTFNQRELKHLSTSIYASIGILAPQFSPPVNEFRAVFLPRYRQLEPPGTYLLINSRGRLGLYGSNNRFHDLNSHNQQLWSTKIAAALHDNCEPQKPLSGFKPAELPRDWYTSASKVIRSWGNVLAARIKTKAENNRIHPLSNQEAAFTLAVELLPACRPIFLGALESLAYAKDPAYRPEFNLSHSSQNPLEIAAAEPDQQHRAALIQWMFSAPYFSSLRSEADQPIYRALTSIVTDQRPFIKGAAELFSCPVPLISRLRNGSLESMNRKLQEWVDDKDMAAMLKFEGLSSHLAIRFLAKVPLSNIPEMGEHFLITREFRSLVKVFSAALKLSFPGGENRRPRNGNAEKFGLLTAGSFLALESLGQATRGQWETQATQLTEERVKGLPHCLDMLSAVAKCTILPRLIHDRFLDAPHTGNLAPQALQTLARSLTLSTFAREVSLVNILKISDRWHKSGVMNTPSSGQARTWSSIIPQQIAPNGCLVIPLTSTAALADEGGAMHHCVGGYGSFCLTGRSQIFSIRSANDGRLSTLELGIDRSVTPPMVSIRQNQGTLNSTAPADAQEAASWLEKGINNGRIEVRWNDVNRTLTHEQANDLCGFDPRDEEAWQREFMGVRQFLPSTLAVASPKEFLMRVKFEELTRQLLAIKVGIDGASVVNH